MKFALMIPVAMETRSVTPIFYFMWTLPWQDPFYPPAKVGQIDNVGRPLIIACFALKWPFSPISDRDLGTDGSRCYGNEVSDPSWVLSAYFPVPAIPSLCQIV